MNPKILEEIISEAVNKALAAAKQDVRKTQWVPTREACEILGSGFTPDLLRSKIEQGLFTYGVHYQNTSDGDRPNYVFKVKEIEAYFAVPPEQRKPAKRSTA